MSEPDVSDPLRSLQRYFRFFRESELRHHIELVRHLQNMLIHLGVQPKVSQDVESAIAAILIGFYGAYACSLSAYGCSLRRTLTCQ